MLRPAGVLEDMVWNIDIFNLSSWFGIGCVESGSECVSSIGNWIVLGFPLLKFGDVVVLK